MSQKKYKLSYFNAKGVAEVTRLLFVVAGKQDLYQDVRVEKEEWAKLKPTMPMKAMPVLEVDGEVICQSAAISRFVANELGLMGKTGLDKARIEEIQETMIEMFSKYIFKMFGESDETKKKELLTAFMGEPMEDYLKFFQSRLSKNKSGFFVGEKATLADIVVYRGLEMAGDVLQKFGSDLAPKLAAYKEVDALCKKVAALPAIAKWVKDRPVTEF